MSLVRSLAKPLASPRFLRVSEFKLTETYPYSTVYLEFLTQTYGTQTVAESESDLQGQAPLA